MTQKYSKIHHYVTQKVHNAWMNFEVDIILARITCKLFIAKQLCYGILFMWTVNSAVYEKYLICRKQPVATYCDLEEIVK